METPIGLSIPSAINPNIIKLLISLIIFGQFIWLIALSIQINHTVSKNDVPNIVLSQTPNSPHGYHYGGNLGSGRGNWVYQPPMPISVSDIVAEKVDDNVLLVGGLLANLTINPHIYLFNAVFNNYSIITQIPNPVYRGAHVVVNYKLYLFGGYLTYANGENGFPTRLLQIFDLKTKIWSKGLDLSISRGDFTAKNNGDIIYLFGGYTDMFDQSKTGKLVERYDIKANSYLRVADMPTKRGDASSISYNGLIYVIGGWSADIDGFTPKFEVYNPNSNSWSSKHDIPYGTGDFGLVLNQNKLYIVGGELFSGYWGTCDFGGGPFPCKVNEIPSHQSLLYDDKNDKWITIAPLIQARYRVACAVQNSTIFTFGGSTENEIATNAVESYPIVDEAIVYYHYKN